MVPDLAWARDPTGATLQRRYWNPLSRLCVRLRATNSAEKRRNHDTTFVVYCNTIVLFPAASAVSKMWRMSKQKKQISHDEIVTRFGRKLQELRVERGMSQAELATRASCTTNYISRLEGGGAAPGIDLVARLAKALGVAIAELLPTDETPEKLSVMRERAKELFDDLVGSKEEAELVLLVQLLARLSGATNR
jgi:transcriptional regulator with XRE-family HTH domain